jgi:hypothetical protein
MHRPIDNFCQPIHRSFAIDGAVGSWMVAIDLLLPELAAA